MLTVVSNKDGRLTIPAEVRAILHIEGEAHWTVEVANGAVVLRPAIVVPREDAWAYTAEHRAKVDRAHRDAQAGREVAVSGSVVGRIAELPDDEMTAEIARLQEEAERGGGGA
jgi:hypothetical protein